MKNKKETYFLGEVLLRLQAKQSEKLLNSLELYVGGAEYNCAVGMSGLGNKTNLLTILPDNSFVSNQILKYAQQYKIDTSKVKQGYGNQGIYFIDTKGSDISAVVYNRKHSAFSESSKLLDKVALGKEGDFLHLSGISLVLSEATYNTALKLIKRAKENKMVISFDFNFREKLTTYSIAKERYSRVLEYADIIFATKRDFVSIFDFDSKLTEEQVFEQIFNKYLSLKYIAHTKRNKKGEQDYLQSILFANEKKYVSKEQGFKMFGRIGGGDSFAAGILDGIINEYSPEEIVKRANGLAIYKQSKFKDDVIHVSNEQLKSFIKSLDK